jgi:hypothetical protein
MIFKVHIKTRSDMLVKYFSEKVSPAVHDLAAKKEGFGAWKEQFLHENLADDVERKYSKF